MIGVLESCEVAQPSFEPRCRYAGALCATSLMVQGTSEANRSLGRVAAASSATRRRSVHSVTPQDSSPMPSADAASTVDGVPSGSRAESMQSARALYVARDAAEQALPPNHRGYSTVTTVADTYGTHGSLQLLQSRAHGLTSGARGLVPGLLPGWAREAGNVGESDGCDAAATTTLSDGALCASGDGGFNSGLAGRCHCLHCSTPTTRRD